MEIVEKKLENSAMELQIQVPADMVDIEYRAVFDQLQKTAKIDGFRKGKVPMELIEKRFLENANAQVAENLLKTHFYNAVIEKKINPITMPQYDYEKINRGEIFSFSAVFDIAPTVELGKYQDIQASEKSCKITDEDVNYEIDSVR